MTFASGRTLEEQQVIWGKDKVIRLLKLYDKSNNFMNSSWMNAERKQRHRGYITELARDVKSNYGDLNIVKIAKALVI